MSILNPKPLTAQALDAAAAALVNNPASALRTAQNATYATLDVVERPQRFYAGHYDTLAECFAARNATSAPAIIELEPSTSYQAANLRIDKPETSVRGEEASITLPPGSNQDVLRIGPDAMSLSITNLRMWGNYANQTGTSRGLIFEPYTGTDFRYSDVTKVEHVRIQGFKDEGAIIGEKRLHVIMDDVFIRDYGTIGLTMLSSDCKFLNGGLGGIRGQYGVKLNAGSNWVESSGIWSNNTAAVWMTEKANGVKINRNDIDNNIGGGIRAVGVASDALDCTISGNHFRGNSTAGDGIHSDIYFEQVSNISLTDNRFYKQLGSTARTKYNVDAGAGVQSLHDPGNPAQSGYATIASWSPTALAARSNRTMTLDLSSFGLADVRFTRNGNGVQVSNDFTTLGTLLASVLSVTGTGGSGFLQFIEQSATPGTPAADRGRIFMRDNGSGKTQTCVIYSDGSVSVLNTQA
jgi:hypothetical protein